VLNEELLSSINIQHSAFPRVDVPAPHHHGRKRTEGATSVTDGTYSDRGGEGRYLGDRWRPRQSRIRTLAMFRGARLGPE